MSIQRSLDRLAAIKAELTKPSNAEAERLNVQFSCRCMPLSAFASKARLHGCD